MAASELECAEEDANSNADAVGEEEALANVTDGVGDAGRLVRGVVTAGRGMLVIVLRRVRVRATRGSDLTLTALELLYGLAEAILRLSQPSLGVRVVLERRRWRRRRRCHFRSQDTEKEFCYCIYRLLYQFYFINLVNFILLIWYLVHARE